MMSSMASEQQSMNGNLNPQSQDFSANDTSYISKNSNGNPSSTDYSTASAGTNGGGNTSAPASEVPKDEVGWYFVEQYYTTLSKSPEKLHLFYNKTSQFVSGLETEKVSVCVGQKAINDRIKELDFQDCKVRVTNVDSQGSRNNIIIQVIGELSNKSAPQRKFTQTFVLAEQTNGYFVLNDIFRYILEDDEEELNGTEEAQTQTAAATGDQETVATTSAPETHPHTLASSDDPAEQAHDAAIVDRELQAAIAREVSSEAAATATETPVEIPIAAELTHAEDAPVAATEPIEEQTEDQAATQTELKPAEIAEVAKEETAQPEKPKDPEPTPAIATPKTASPAPTPAPAKPAVPKTWANLVAGGQRAPVPAATSSSSGQANSSTSNALQQTKSAAPAASQPAAAPAPSAPAPAAAAPAAATPASDEIEQATTQSSGSEWQMAGDHGKKATRGGASAQGGAAQQQQPAENNRAYIKNVSEGIDGQALRNVLDKVAQVTYLDINRQKNCAFVDFATPAGYQAAVAANPHVVGEERLFIEERRIRPQGFNGPFPGRGGAAGGNRGGRGGADGGNRAPGQGRGGFGGKEGGRGGFTGGRGRGGAGARGRGGAVANAA